MADECYVDLYWLPGAAGTLSRPRKWSLDLFEAVAALLARRPRAALLHSALKVRAAGAPYAIEVTPMFADERHAPLMTGLVGVRWAGRFRLFRYQLRCVEGGRLPDEEWVVGHPVRLSSDCDVASRVLALGPVGPPRTWGLRARGTRKMWTSDSSIAWLLASSEIDVTGIAMPAKSRAPGWVSGAELVARAR